VFAIDPFNSNHVLYGTGATMFGSDDVTNADHGASNALVVGGRRGIEETAVDDLVAPPAGPCQLISAVGDLGGSATPRSAIRRPPG